MTLQLEDILIPKKIETVDSKITNFSILATKKLNNMKVVDEYKIEGFQNFQHYLKINPINIQITNPEIQNFTERDINIDLLLIVYYLVRQLKRYKRYFYYNKWFKRCKKKLINGKLYQGIGIIFTSEIDGWEKIKTKSHWTNVLLTDSIYSIAAKHFAFGFQTRDLQIY